MALAHSPRTVTDGLVFYMDQGNTYKSWKGKPATNFLTNGHFSGGNKITQESGSNPTNEIIVLRNPGSSEYVLRQTGTVGYTEYQLNLTTQLAAGTTYVMSGWYAESSNYSCADGSRMFHSRAYSTSGAHVSLGIGIGTILETKVVDGITWKYCYATITTPADYSNVFEWYVGYGSSAYTGHRYYTDLQVEIGTLPSRFVNGTRSNTQALLDLTGRNTITATSLTYTSDGSFSFDGVDDKGSFTSPITSASPQSYEIWTNVIASSSAVDGYAYILHNNSSGSGTGTSYLTVGIRPTQEYFAAFNGAYASMGTGVTANNSNVVQIVLSWDGSVQRVYVNGELKNSQALTTTPQNFSSTTTFGDYVSTYRMIQGSIYVIKAYNRALTQEEIQQNFNALRGRYGI